MPSRLYVGNLSYQTTDESLRQFFSTAGAVKDAEVVMDRQMGRSKGFAFVEMMTDDEAQNAINLLNGKMLDQRPLRIDFAKPKEARSYSMNGSGGSSSGSDRGRRPPRSNNRDNFRD